MDTLYIILIICPYQQQAVARSSRVSGFYKKTVKTLCFSRFFMFIINLDVFERSPGLFLYLVSEIFL